MSPRLGDIYRLAADNQRWTSPGRADIPLIPPAPPPRTSLVAGVDRPVASTVGLIDTSVTMTNVNPSTPSAYINITVPGTYSNNIYWGTVRPQTSGVIFDNCIFAGTDTSTLTGLRGCIQNYGTGPAHFEMYNCVIDPGLWMTLRGVVPGIKGAYVFGIHGGNVTMKWCEVVNCPDGINYSGPNDLTLANAAYSLIEMNWFHKAYYANDWYGQSDGQPHNDGIQITGGKNITIRGNVIGGHRDAAGYIVWPGGYNSGDDFWNAGLMIKQEVLGNAAAFIENVLIEKNWLGGGVATINQTATADNWMATNIIRDNWLLERQASWGYKMSGDGPTTDTGHRTDTATPGGYYILRPTGFQGTFSNNRIISAAGVVGGLAPITNG